MSYKYIRGSRRVDKVLGALYRLTEIGVLERRTDYEIDVSSEQRFECFEQAEISVRPRAGLGRFELDQEIDVAVARTVLPRGDGAEHIESFDMKSPAKRFERIEPLGDFGTHSNLLHEYDNPGVE
jgi:hypothetical protein